MAGLYSLEPTSFPGPSTICQVSSWKTPSRPLQLHFQMNSKEDIFPVGTDAQTPFPTAVYNTPESDHRCPAVRTMITLYQVCLYLALCTEVKEESFRDFRL